MVNIDATTPQLKVVKNWIDALISLDTSKVVPLICRNFKYQSLPHATELPEIREQAKEMHIQWLEGLMASVSNLKMPETTVHEVIEAPGKVVIHITYTITLIDGTTYDYDSLTVLSLVEEDGEIKILDCKDFSDPHKRGAFYAGIAKVVKGMVPV